ncbi:hypothetical protein EON67_10695 [archaeon]|nr:MAG: hypothetical protein EON67_10695 [archaeon]
MAAHTHTHTARALFSAGCVQGQYLCALVAELANNERPENIRQLAGLQIKNALDSSVCVTPDANARQPPRACAQLGLTRATIPCVCAAE